MPTEEDLVFHWTGFKNTSPDSVGPQTQAVSQEEAAIWWKRFKERLDPIILTYPISEEEIRLILAFRRFKSVMLAPEATFTWRTSDGPR